MKRVFAVGCLAVLAVFAASRLGASPLVVGDAPSYRLGGHLEILRDDTGEKTLAQISSSSASWQSTTEDEPNLGFTKAIYWVRFQLESRTAHRLLLAYDWANVDLVNVFVVHVDGVLEQMQSGTHIPFCPKVRTVPLPALSPCPDARTPGLVLRPGDGCSQRFPPLGLGRRGFPQG